MKLTHKAGEHIDYVYIGMAGKYPKKDIRSFRVSVQRLARIMAKARGSNCVRMLHVDMAKHYFDLYREEIEDWKAYLDWVETEDENLDRKTLYIGLFGKKVEMETVAEE